MRTKYYTITIVQRRTSFFFSHYLYVQHLIRIFIIEHELTFNFTLNTGTTRKLVINSKRKLNGGEWHKIWIDYNFYHVRFMLNTEYQMLNLLLEEEFGPFEGSMFIGGATA